MLSYTEIDELERTIKAELPDKLLGILTKLNRTGELDSFLSMIEMTEHTLTNKEYEVYKTGKIVIIGQSDVKAEVLLSIANKLGISKDRFELLLEYNDAKKYNFNKLQWDPTYCAVLVGPMPHSGKSKGDHGSILSAIENEQGYPPVIRMGETSLKITKSQFRKKIVELIAKKIVV